MTQVHPSAGEATQYDVIVLGAGAGGENVADRAVQGGLSAVLIEHELVGGECSYWACMPSKALLRSAQALRAARDVPGAAQAITGQLDVPAVLARRDSFTHNWSDDGQVQWVNGAGIALARGHGRITGPKQVTVTAAHGATTTLTARHAVVVATGSDPLIPTPSPACATHGLGRAERRPAPRPCPPAWPSSAVASWPPRWQPPTPVSAPPSP
jgi:dihydrolipoamide dehydrogenase